MGDPLIRTCESPPPGGRAFVAEVGGRLGDYQLRAAAGTQFVPLSLAAFCDRFEPLAVDPSGEASFLLQLAGRVPAVLPMVIERV